jgi:hypothetical protein
MAILKDVDGNLVETSTDPVKFVVSGVTASTTTVCSAGGTATMTVRSTTRTGNISVWCSLIIGTVTSNSEIIQLAAIPIPEPAKIRLTCNKSELTADGNSGMLVRAGLTDMNGNELGFGNNMITFNIEGEGNIVSGTETLKTAYVQANAGTAEINVKSTTIAGDMRITTGCDSVDSGSMTFKTRAGTAVKLVCEPELNSITADGISKTTIRARVKDYHDNTVQSYSGNVTFSVTGPGIIITPVVVPVMNGTAESIVRSQVSIGTITVTVSGSGLITGTGKLFTSNSDETGVVIELNPVQIHSGETADVTVKIVDKTGNVIPVSHDVNLSGIGSFSMKNVVTSLLTGTTVVAYTGTIAGEIPITCTVPGLDPCTIIASVLSSTQIAGVNIKVSTPSYAPGIINVVLSGNDKHGNNVDSYAGKILLKIFNKNTGEIVFSSQVVINNGSLQLPLFVRSPGVYTFETTDGSLPVTSENTVLAMNRTRNNSVQLFMPQGTVKVFISSGVFDNDTIVELVRYSDTAAVELIVRDKNGIKTGFELNGTDKLMLSMPYSDVDNDGIVDGTTVREENLRLWQFDNDNWQLVTTANTYSACSVPDNQQNIVTVPVTKPGIYQLMGISTDPQIFNPVVYPTPFMTTAVISFELGSQADIIVNIFTLSGRLVRVIRTQLTNPVIAGNKQLVSMNFDGCDDTGKPISSGVYIYKIIVQNDNIKYSKTGKLIKAQ